MHNGQTGILRIVDNFCRKNKNRVASLLYVAACQAIA